MNGVGALLAFASGTLLRSNMECTRPSGNSAKTFPWEWKTISLAFHLERSLGERS